MIQLQCEKSEQFIENRLFKLDENDPTEILFQIDADYLQLTYDGLRLGPDGRWIGGWEEERGAWVISVKRDLGAVEGWALNPDPRKDELVEFVFSDLVIAS